MSERLGGANDRVTRRRFLATGAASLTAAASGCTSSSRSSKDELPNLVVKFSSEDQLLNSVTIELHGDSEQVAATFDYEIDGALGDKYPDFMRVDCPGDQILKSAIPRGETEFESGDGFSRTPHNYVDYPVAGEYVYRIFSDNILLEKGRYAVVEEEDSNAN